MRGEVVSVQVGRPATLPWRGNQVRTAFVKESVGPRRLAVAADGFAEDEQGDLKLHGGPDKALCCYASEHLPQWSELLGRELAPGAFGENLTLRGLTEEHVHIGDTYRLGDAVVQVSQPRGPCFKIAARWGSQTLVRELGRQLKAGFYLRVLEPGAVAAGDAAELVEPSSAVSVAEVLRVSYRDRGDGPALEAVMAVPELAEQWRAGLVKLAGRLVEPL